MSFTIIEQATPRLHRSELAVPGSNPGMFEKAAQSAADIIFLDVEDAVAPDDKEQARKTDVSARLLAGLQPDRDGVLQVQGAAARGSRANYPRLVGSHPHRTRRLHAK
jgi:citrate lyase beta subunit